MGKNKKIPKDSDDNDDIATDVKEPEEESELVMYILVNNDLSMGKGKIAGQVGHAVGHIVEEILEGFYNSKSKKATDAYNRFKIWNNNGSKKIVLKVSEEYIQSLIGTPESVYINDMGLTQIKPDSLTVMGFYPSTGLRTKFKDLKLL